MLTERGQLPALKHAKPDCNELNVLHGADHSEAEKMPPMPSLTITHATLSFQVDILIFSQPQGPTTRSHQHRPFKGALGFLWLVSFLQSVPNRHYFWQQLRLCGTKACCPCIQEFARHLRDFSNMHSARNGVKHMIDVGVDGRLIRR